MGGRHPDPSHWPEPEWDAAAQFLAARQRSTQIEVHALAHYIHEGHPFHVAMRSPNAARYLKPGQYIFFARVDDANEFWRIRDRLEKRYNRGLEPPSGEGRRTQTAR